MDLSMPEVDGVEAAAEQYGVTAEAYCSSMSRAGVWGGGVYVLGGCVCAGACAGQHVLSACAKCMC